MRRKWMQLLALVGGVLAASPLFAQATAAANAAAAANPASWAKPLAAVLGMGIAAGLCGIGQGMATAHSADGLARNPGATNAIRTMVILGLALIESLALYTLVIAIIVIFTK